MTVERNKTNDNNSIQEYRKKQGEKCGYLGIGLNIFLFVVKLIASVISHSISILADAFNNLSDAGSSIITIVGFKLSSKKPDREHPFGHGRFEYVAGLAVAFIIFAMAVELFRSSVDKIIHPKETMFDYTVCIILVFSIAVKLFMYFYNRKIGRRISSPVLLNNAKDSISDVISTSVVFISLLISHFSDFQLDGYAGAAVAIFIFIQAYEAARDTISPLLGEAPDPKLIEEISQTVLSYPCVLGVHDVVIHNYGYGSYMMSLHVNVASNMSLIEAHDVTDEIERFLDEKYSCTSVIHIDPIEMNDNEADEIIHKISLMIMNIGPEITYHDFRLIKKDEKKIISIDLAVPFKYKISNEDIHASIIKSCSEELPGYDLYITIDNY